MITIRKSVGSRTEPWMTFEFVQKDLEEWPFKTILILRSDKIESD